MANDNNTNKVVVAHLHLIMNFLEREIKCMLLIVEGMFLIVEGMFLIVEGMFLIVEGMWNN